MTDSRRLCVLEPAAGRHMWFSFVLLTLGGLTIGQACLGSERQHRRDLERPWSVAAAPTESLIDDAAWCGPRAAYAVCFAEGLDVGLPALIAWSDCDESGYTTMGGVKQALETSGLHTLPGRTDCQGLLQTGLRAILLFYPPEEGVAATKSRGTGHAVVYFGHARDGFVILDPRSVPMVRVYSQADMDSRWHGQAMFVSRRRIHRQVSWPAYVVSLVSCGMVALALFAAGGGALRVLRDAPSRARRSVAALCASAALAVVAIGLGLVLTRNSVEPRAASQVAEVLTCEPQEAALGAFAADGSSLPFELKVTNVSGGPVTISDVKRSCSCVAVDVPPRALAPGETVAIEGRLDTAKLATVGVFRHSVAFVGTVEGGQTVLAAFYIHGTSLPVLKSEPAELLLRRKGMEGYACGTFRLCRGGHGTHPGTPGMLRITGTVEGLAWDVLSAEHFARGGGQWVDAYVVSVAGYSQGELQIDIQESPSASLCLPVRVMAGPPFVVTPPQVVLSAPGSAHGVASIRRSDGANLRIISAASRKGIVHVAFDQLPAATCDLGVELQAEVAPDSARSFLFDEVTAKVSTDGGDTAQVSLPVCVLHR